MRNVHLDPEVYPYPKKFDLERWDMPSVRFNLNEDFLKIFIKTAPFPFDTNHDAFIL